MNFPTMDQARDAAKELDAPIEIWASDGRYGMISFTLPGLTVGQAREAVDLAFGGRAFDAEAITISRDRLEESDMPIATITIKTMEF